MYDELRIPSTSRVFKQRLRQWRPVLSQIVTVLILAAFAYWGWQNRLIMQQVFAELGTIKLMSFCLLLTLGVVLSALSFTILVRSIGYQFTYRDGYHSLNLSQIAAMVPGKIWGFAGLASLLSARGIPNRDSVLVICSTYPAHTFSRCVRWHLWSDTRHWVGLHAAVSGSGDVAPGWSFLVRNLALPFLHGQFSAPFVVKRVVHAYSKCYQLGSSLDLLCPARV